MQSGAARCSQVQPGAAKCSQYIILSSQSLAGVAFGKPFVEGSDGRLMDLGELVSRKKEFIPPLQRAIGGGWTIPDDVEEAPLEATELFVDELDPYARVMRRRKPVFEHRPAGHMED